MRYVSDPADFAPIDIRTPEGAARMREIFDYAMSARMRKPAKEGNVRLRYDSDGILKEEAVPSAYVIVIVVPEQEDLARNGALFDFARDFAAAYLAPSGNRVLRPKIFANFNAADEYNSIIVFKNDEGGPIGITAMDKSFGTDNCRGRPAFMFDRGDIKSVFLNSSSETIKQERIAQRMVKAWKQYQDHVNSISVSRQPIPAFQRQCS